MKIYPRSEASHLGPFTAGVSEVDAWGKLHLRRVTWLPQIVEDEGLEGAGLVLVAWDRDCPPISATHVQFGGVAFPKVIEEASGAHSHVVTPCRVESLDNLVAGTYYVS